MDHHDTNDDKCNSRVSTAQAPPQAARAEAELAALLERLERALAGAQRPAADRLRLRVKRMRRAYEARARRAEALHARPLRSASAPI
jgi:hypothetical protein